MRTRLSVENEGPESGTALEKTQHAPTKEVIRTCRDYSDLVALIETLRAESASWLEPFRSSIAQATRNADLGEDNEL